MNDQHEQGLDHDLLVRIDERTRKMASEMTEFHSKFVTRSEFRPIMWLVYGGVSTVLTGIAGGLLTLILRTPK